MANILLIDDDAERLSPLVEELEFDRIHQVTVAPNIDKAFEYLRAPAPEIDMIILDLIMAHGDKYTKGETTDGRETGYCLLKDIREGRQGFKINTDVPIIVLTNIRKDDFLKEKITRYENVIYLEKPVTFDEIYESIDRLLEIEK
jgi:CheY-like chemotaxis protein